MIRVLVLTALAVLPVCAQFGGGLKVGLPLTDAIDVAKNPTLGNAFSRQYTIGPAFELRLPAGFAIELDALYTRFELNRPGSTLANVAGNSWEFPLVGKKRFGSHIVRPFIEVGASFRRLGGLKNIGNFIVGSEPPPSADPVADRNSTGFVVGAGLELRLPFIRIAPGLRFTRWGTESFAEGVRNVFETNKTQGQLLVGISF